MGGLCLPMEVIHLLEHGYYANIYIPVHLPGAARLVQIPCEVTPPPKVDIDSLLFFNPLFSPHFPPPLNINMIITNIIDYSIYFPPPTFLGDYDDTTGWNHYREGTTAPPITYFH